MMEFLKKYQWTPEAAEDWHEGMLRENARQERESAEVAAETGFQVGDKVRRTGTMKIGTVAELSRDVKGRARATVRWPRRGVFVDYHHSTLLISGLAKVEPKDPR